MGTSEVTLLVVVLLALMVAGVSVAVSYLALASLRRGIRRLGAQLREVRRHPLIGEIPPESAPILRDLSRNFNGLLDELRQQVGELQTHASELQALAEGPSDTALIGIDVDYQVTRFNRGAVNLTQWDPEEIVGHHVEALFAPGEWEQLLPKLARRSLREAGISERVVMQRRDGGSVPTRMRVESYPVADGKADPGIVLVARDLSSEESLQRRLLASEERYRCLVEEIQDGALILKAGRVTYANPALARMVGIEREALQNIPFKELIHARDLLPVMDGIRLAETGERTTGDTLCLLANRSGPPVEARLTWSATDFQGGRAVFATVADLTERARFERTLSESEARLRSTMHATRDGILVIGDAPEGPAVSIVNDACCDLFGLDPDGLAGLDEAAAMRLLAERCADPEAVQATFDAARAGEETLSEAVEIRIPRRALVDLLAGPVRSSEGRTIGWILTIRDVTARADGESRLRSRVEEQSQAKANLEISCRELAEAKHALTERNRQLEKLNKELQSLDEMKSNLLANVSHELHTPLVSIKGYTEMIVRRKLGPLTPEQERGLSVALKNIDRLIEMIDNLLSFARMELGETQLDLEDVPLWQLVDGAIEMVAERIKKRNLSVTTQYESDDLLVRGDRVKFGQVFTNLLTNAVKFNKDGGSIRVTARKGAKGLVEVQVADSGIGIPREEQQRIFERFYQTDSGPRRRYEGAGIGLSIVRDILRLHACSIRVDSEPDRGTVFTFTLPMARVPEPRDARHQVNHARPVE